MSQRYYTVVLLCDPFSLRKCLAWPYSVAANKTSSVLCQWIQNSVQSKILHAWSVSWNTHYWLLNRAINHFRNQIWNCKLLQRIGNYVTQRKTFIYCNIQHFPVAMFRSLPAIWLLRLYPVLENWAHISVIAWQCLSDVAAGQVSIPPTNKKT